MASIADNKRSAAERLRLETEARKLSRATFSTGDCRIRARAYGHGFRRCTTPSPTMSALPATLRIGTNWGPSGRVRCPAVVPSSLVRGTRGDSRACTVWAIVFRPMGPRFGRCVTQADCVKTSPHSGDAQDRFGVQDLPASTCRLRGPLDANRAHCRYGTAFSHALQEFRTMPNQTGLMLSTILLMFRAEPESGSWSRRKAEFPDRCAQ